MRSIAFISLITIFGVFLFLSNRDNKKNIKVIEKGLKESFKTKEFQKSLIVVNEQLKKNNLGQETPLHKTQSESDILKYDWKLDKKNEFKLPLKIKEKIYTYMDFVKNLDTKKKNVDPIKYNEVKEIIPLLKNSPESTQIWQAMITSEEFLDCNVCLISLMKLSKYTDGNKKELYRRAEIIITSNAIGDNVESMNRNQKFLSDYNLYKESVDFYLEQNKEDISNGDDTSIFKIKAANPHPDIIEFMENKIKGF